MYSRSYYADEQSKLALPGNYNGTTFIGNLPEAENEAQHTEVIDDVTVEASAHGCKSPNSLGTLPFLSSLFGEKGQLKLPNIGIEEILIIATAAFLFFSKDGDKESAIILLLLLLVN